MYSNREQLFYIQKSKNQKHKKRTWPQMLELLRLFTERNCGAHLK